MEPIYLPAKVGKLRGVIVKYDQRNKKIRNARVHPQFLEKRKRRLFNGNVC